MTKDEYDNICRICDSILLDKEATLVTTSIPWLHVLNEHPSNQAKYASLFENDFKLDKPGVYTAALRGFIKSSLSIVKKASLKRWKYLFDDSAQVIFISHLLNEGQITGDKDFYFGTLPSFLAGQNIPTVSIMLNHSSVADNIVQKKWQELSLNRFVFPESLSVFRELYIRLALLRESKRLARKSRSAKSSIEKKIFLSAAFEALSASSILSGRTYYFTEWLIRHSAVKTIFTTFEGHAWERMIFAAANNSVKHPMVSGYHHTILFPQQHAALRPLQQSFEPGYILTSGNITKKKFQLVNSYPDRVRNIGIHRIDPSANTGFPDISGRGQVCVALPDGIIFEVLIIFRLIIQAAKKAPHISFILRLHPVVSKENLLRDYPEFTDLPSNVSFSEKDLPVDFARARWAVYRGSNSALYAVMAGLRPIYVAKQGELSIDSLNDLPGWKRIVENASELTGIFDKDLTTPVNELQDESVNAINFCRQYFMPLDIPAFSALIKSCLN